ncbi:hypothetical protein Celaphus_00003854 [Cervus elaphus hippelaphus]|uniref:Uncharacterized protein n=1 Tax=Cervus elaphus hippelaphus TaxID=46360 RepID=A0A212D1M0_CEREH|nr:hypothetical protein Celaphus_00003854 [Cervus elaphus hippelaphus]
MFNISFKDSPACRVELLRSREISFPQGKRGLSRMHMAPCPYLHVFMPALLCEAARAASRRSPDIVELTQPMADTKRVMSPVTSAVAAI